VEWEEVTHMSLLLLFLATYVAIGPSQYVRVFHILVSSYLVQSVSIGNGF
jgi:hypothetical protein